jgi:hypothetical protein
MMSNPEQYVHKHTLPSGYSGGFGIPMPPEGEPCSLCGERPGQPHQCLMDGRAHGHGMTHIPTESGRRSRPEWLCCSCIDSLILGIKP